MSDSTNEELLTVLKELLALCPEVRFGQLIVNLSYLARGPAAESTWDVDDAELLKAAKTQLETLRARHVSVA